MAAALVAGMAWMAAMTQLELSHAYPFMGLTFILVLLLSGFLFSGAGYVDKNSRSGFNCGWYRRG